VSAGDWRPAPGPEPAASDVDPLTSPLGEVVRKLKET
jgi:hypothetical protein